MRPRPPELFTGLQLAIATVIIIAIAFACSLAWAVLIHGDWRCALAQCRLVTK